VLGRAIYLDGAVAGIIGAVIIAIWFLFLDTVTRLPLYTPTVLGESLFLGGQGFTPNPGEHSSLKFTLMYTGIHGLVFVLLGVIAAYGLLLAKRSLNFGLSILALFAVLQFGFLGTASVLSGPALSELAWWTVLIGNLLAASGMAGYLQLRGEKLRQGR